MDNLLKKIDIVISWIERNILISSAFSITMLTFFSTINRYFLKISLPWIEEITILFYMFLVYYGASNVEKDNSHLRVSYFESKLINNPKASFFQSLYVNIISFIVLLLGIIYGFVMILTTTRKTTYLAIPYTFILTVTFWFGLIFYAFRVFSKIYFLIMKNKYEIKE